MKLKVAALSAGPFLIGSILILSGLSTAFSRTGFSPQDSTSRRPTPSTQIEARELDAFLLVPRLELQLGVGTVMSSALILFLSLRWRFQFGLSMSSRRRLVWAALLTSLTIFAYLAFADVWCPLVDCPLLSPIVAQLGILAIGWLGFGSLLLATVCGALLFGVRRSILLLAAPATLALMVGLAIFKVNEMILRPTMFLTWLSVRHLDLVSNWTVLELAGVLSIAGLLDLARRATRAEGYGKH